MAKKKIKPLDDQSSTYTAEVVSWSPPANPTWTATIELGDNSDASGGISEVNLNTSSGQLAWGTDSNGNVNSNVNYSSGVYVELDIPTSTTSPQSAATLTVGDTNIEYTTAHTYDYIIKVAIEAYTNVGSVPAISGCIQVSWSDIVCTFYDANNVATSNPDVTGTNIPPVAWQGICDGMAVHKGGGPTVKPLNTTTANWVLIVPAPQPGFVPVRVNITGTLVLSSTDTYYQNYPELAATSLKAKILVWADVTS